MPVQKVMVPEDNFPQFSLEKAPSDDKAGNDRPIMPMNQFINSDQSTAEKLATLQETYFSKLNQITQKLNSVDRLSQGTSLQVLQKENEWKEKLSVIEKDYKRQIETLTKDVESAQNDK